MEGETTVRMGARYMFARTCKANTHPPTVSWSETFELVAGQYIAIDREDFMATFDFANGANVVGKPSNIYQVYVFFRGRI